MNFLHKANQLLLFIIFLMILLYVGAAFLIPFVFGIFFAMLMAPLCNTLEGLNVNRTLSSFISTLLIFISISGLAFLFSFQLNEFLNDLPSIKEELNLFIKSIQDKITSLTGFSTEEQNNIWRSRSEDFLKAVESHITRFLGNFIEILAKFLLMLVYLFLLLLYRKKFPKFLMMYVNEGNRGRAKVIVRKISKVSYQYLLGRVKVMSILAVLYYITFLIFGLPFAILLTVFGALVTVIPYIGPLISGVLPIIFALIYLNGTYTILLFAVIVTVIQLIESYVLEPVIIGKEVRINPLLTIIAVILGGIFWGIAGMILFVPIFATMKIIFIHNPKLKPVGYLFGYK